MKRRKGTGVRCSFVFEETGETCRAWAVRESVEDEDGPRCFLHRGTAEQRSQRARRAGQLGAVKRRGEIETAPRLSGLDPGVTLAQLMPILYDALTARYEHDGSIDHGTRLAGVGTLLSGWPRIMRSDPEACRDLLRRAIPPEILTVEMLDTERVYKELRRSWNEVDGLRWSDLKGLYVAQYPAWMLAPWEDRVRIQRSRPAPIPPELAPVRRLPDGRPILERTGAFPLVLEEDDSELVHA